MADEKLEKLKEIINNSKYLVFFGGAGVSTESGVPDFRSVDGLYNQKYDYPPETILSHTFFMRKTEEFYKFYRDMPSGILYSSRHYLPTDFLYSSSCFCASSIRVCRPLS